MCGKVAFCSTLGATELKKWATENRLIQNIENFDAPLGEMQSKIVWWPGLDRLLVIHPLILFEYLHRFRQALDRYLVLHVRYLTTACQASPQASVKQHKASVKHVPVGGMQHKPSVNRLTQG